MIISSNILSVREKRLEHEQKAERKTNNEAIIVNKSENKSSLSISNKFESFCWAEFVLLFTGSVIDQHLSLHLNYAKLRLSGINELLSSTFTSFTKSLPT